MTNYILIDAKTRAPVPLPYECIMLKPNGHCCRIVGIREEGNINYTDQQGTWVGWPSLFGLALITEEEFMAERD